MKFNFNLIREMQEERLALKKANARITIALIICYGILASALAYGATKVTGMRNIVLEKRLALNKSKSEFQQYKATEMIVSKADIDLLEQLHSSRILWTKKFLVMARHLPEKYWVTRFGYDYSSYIIDGYGYLEETQDQLLSLHEYLKNLRSDEDFNDMFLNIGLSSTQRKDVSGNRKMVDFNIVCGGGAR